MASGKKPRWQKRICSHWWIDEMRIGLSPGILFVPLVLLFILRKATEERFDDHHAILATIYLILHGSPSRSFSIFLFVESHSPVKSKENGNEIWSKPSNWFSAGEIASYNRRNHQCIKESSILDHLHAGKSIEMLEPRVWDCWSCTKQSHNTTCCH